jgi:hypothetical protein
LKIQTRQIPVERVRGWSSDLDLLRQIGSALDTIPADAA